MQRPSLSVLLFLWVADVIAYLPSMTTVPAGSISVGTGADPDPWAPPRSVTITAFSISTNEVTNQDYVEYLNALPATSLVPDSADPSYLRLWDTASPFHGQVLIRVMGASSTDPTGPQIIDMGVATNPRFVPATAKGALPVNWVSYYGAKAFARYFNKDLPTVVEWEAAAGTSLYATSGTVQCGTNAICGATHPATITDSKMSTAASGVRGMVGNVAEWTTDNEGNSSINTILSSVSNPQNSFGYDSNKAPATEQRFYNRKIVKGGSFKDSATTLPQTKTHRSYPYGYTGADVGFRVVDTPGGRYEFVVGVLEECYPNEYQLPPVLVAGTKKISVTCAPCHSSCESCRGPGTDQCLSCPGNTQPTPNGTCNCPTGYTYTTDGKCKDANGCGVHQFWNNGICSECDPMCKTCASTFSACTSCRFHSVITTTASCQCAAGYMQTPEGCLPDGSGIMCAHGYTKATTGCSLCDKTCRDCTGPGNNQCSFCWPNADLDATTHCICQGNYAVDEFGKCKCPAGFYIDPANNACTACQPPCQTCSLTASA